jgi:hypothetical protein
VLLILIHIGKPGYILPVLPLALLALGVAYARMPPPVAVCLVALMGAINAAQFLALHPFSETTLGLQVPYRSRTASQKLASNLQTVTFVTRSAVRESDAAVAALLAEMQQHCPDGRALVIAEIEPVDWRRVMWYFPNGVAVDAVEREVLFTATGRRASPVPGAGLTYDLPCPVFWVGSPRAARIANIPAGAVLVPGLGYRIPPGLVRVSPSRIEFVRTPR